MMRVMPTVPAPTAWRDRDNLSMEQRGIRYADMLEEKILDRGPGRACSPSSWSRSAVPRRRPSWRRTAIMPRIREICDRYGILLIHDEVMSGAGRTGKFLGGDHWNCKPDIVALSKGLGSGYAPLGALAAPMRLVEPLLASGGFQHGHTYAGNPLACAAGLAVLGEMDRLDLIANAAAMGDVLMDGLKGLAKRFPFIADVRGKGLLTGAEMVADPETLRPIEQGKKATQRLLDLAYERGLIIYGRRVKGGVDGDNFMVAPPMIVTANRSARSFPSLAIRWRFWPPSSTCRSKAEGRKMAPRKVIITCAVTGSIAHAVDVALSAGHAGRDRRAGDRGGRSRRLDPASPCPRSQGRAADRRSRRVHAVPAAHQAGDRCGHQHHHRRLDAA